jgi:hypothetical protein
MWIPLSPADSMGRIPPPNLREAYRIYSKNTHSPDSDLMHLGRFDDPCNALAGGFDVGINS